MTLESRNQRYEACWALIATVLALLGVTGGPSGAIPSQTAGVTIFLAIIASFVVGFFIGDIHEVVKVFPFVQLAPFVLGILVSFTMPLDGSCLAQQPCYVDMPRIVVVSFNIFYLAVLAMFSLVGAFSGTLLGEHRSDQRWAPTLRPLDPAKTEPKK